MGGKVGENPAALRAAVFSLSSKNLRGAFKRPPAGRGLTNKRRLYISNTELWMVLVFVPMPRNLRLARALLGLCISYRRLHWGLLNAPMISAPMRNAQGRRHRGWRVPYDKKLGGDAPLAWRRVQIYFLSTIP